MKVQWQVTAPEIREEMKEIAEKRRRIGLFLERKGMIIDHDKLYRLSREDGLSVKRRRGRKRASGTRTPMPGAAHPDTRWLRGCPAGQLRPHASSAFSR